MRVLFITGEYPPLQGGIADYTAILRAELRALDVASEVLTSSDCASTEPTVHPVVGAWGFPFWSIAQQIISERQIDLVHIQYQTAAFDLKPAINLLPWYLRRHTPRPAIVTTFHDLRTPYLFPKAGPVRRWVTHMLGRHSDSLIFTSQEDRGHWETVVEASVATAQKTPTHQIYVGPNVSVAPITAVRRQALRAECGVAENAFLVGFFGFVNSTKGLDTLFEAVRLLRDRNIPVQVLIVGGSVGDSDPSNTIYKEHLERLIRRLDLDMGDILLSTGYLEAGDASRALATCDAMALPFTDGASLRRASPADRSRPRPAGGHNLSQASDTGATGERCPTARASRRPNGPEPGAPPPLRGPCAGRKPQHRCPPIRRPILMAPHRRTHPGGVHGSLSAEVACPSESASTKCTGKSSI